MQIDFAILDKKLWIFHIILVYIDVGRSAVASAVLAFTFAGAAQTIGRVWEIKVSQIECENLNRPPSGCLQYHTQTEGRLQTFNFGQTNAVNYGHISTQK